MSVVLDFRKVERQLRKKRAKVESERIGKGRELLHEVIYQDRTDVTLRQLEYLINHFEELAPEIFDTKVSGILERADAAQAVLSKRRHLL